MTEQRINEILSKGWPTDLAIDRQAWEQARLELGLDVDRETLTARATVIKRELKERS